VDASQFLTVKKFKTMTQKAITNDTPIAMLTVGQLKAVLGTNEPPSQPAPTKETKYVYGIRGIAHLFNCSIPTASRIKRDGKIDAAIKQIGRKIVTDADLALELAGRKIGGRR